MAIVRSSCAAAAVAALLTIPCQLALMSECALACFLFAAVVKQVPQNWALAFDAAGGHSLLPQSPCTYVFTLERALPGWILMSV